MIARHCWQFRKPGCLRPGWFRSALPTVGIPNVWFAISLPTRLLKPYLAQRFAVLMKLLPQASNPFPSEHDSLFQDDAFMTIQPMPFLKAKVATAQQLREDVYAPSH